MYLLVSFFFLWMIKREVYWSYLLLAEIGCDEVVALANLVSILHSSQVYSSFCPLHPLYQ